MAWLFIDITIKQITYHSDDACSKVIEKEETEDTGIGEIRKNGGWVQFSDLSDAVRFQKEKYPDFALFQHC